MIDSEYETHSKDTVTDELHYAYINTEIDG